MTEVSGIGSGHGRRSSLQAPVSVYGHRIALFKNGLNYVIPKLPGEFSDLQRANYAKQVARLFAEMTKSGSGETGFWTQRGIQINLFNEVMANGNYRVLEKDGRVAAILLFKGYEKGPEAEAAAIKLINEVADRNLVDNTEFTEFISAFCREARQDLGARIIISQEKKGETTLSNILLSAGFRRVNVDREPVQYKSYQTSNVYAIYQKELA
jgi:hypothetical protein